MNTVHAIRRAIRRFADSHSTPEKRAEALRAIANRLDRATPDDLDDAVVALREVASRVRRGGAL